MPLQRQEKWQNYSCGSFCNSWTVQIPWTGRRGAIKSNAGDMFWRDCGKKTWLSAVTKMWSVQVTHPRQSPLSKIMTSQTSALAVHSPLNKIVPNREWANAAGQGTFNRCLKKFFFLSLSFSDCFLHQKWKILKWKILPKADVSLWH